MIAKKVTMRSQRKSSMTELITYLTEELVRDGPEALVNYMTDEQGNPIRVGHVRITHCQATEPAWAAAEMRAVQRMNKRAVSDRTYHMIISFPEDETPDLTTLHTIEDRFCQALGFAEHQRISVVHQDTDHLHIHIAINKIHPKTLRLHDPYYDHRTRSRVCAQLEAEFNLTPGNHRAHQSEAEAHAADMTARTGVGSLITWMKAHCQADLEQAKTWSTLRQVLRDHDLDLRPRANGFVFVTRDGTRCKASSVSRQLSMPALLARLGPMPSAESVRETGEPPRRSYPRTPAGLRPEMAALFSRYQAEQARFRALKAERRAAAKRDKDKRVAAAKRRAKLERAAVKLLSRGLSARLAYLVIHTRLRAELVQASKDYAQDRKSLQERYPLSAWRDWLSSQRNDHAVEAAMRNRGHPVRGNAVITRVVEQDRGGGMDSERSR